MGLGGVSLVLPCGAPELLANNESLISQSELRKEERVLLQTIESCTLFACLRLALALIVRHWALWHSDCCCDEPFRPMIDDVDVDGEE